MSTIGYGTGKPSFEDESEDSLAVLRLMIRNLSRSIAELGATVAVMQQTIMDQTFGFVNIHNIHNILQHFFVVMFLLVYEQRIKGMIYTLDIY
jgi:hypothetical protein